MLENSSGLVAEVKYLKHVKIDFEFSAIHHAESPQWRLVVLI